MDQISEQLRRRFQRRIEEVGFNKLLGIKMVDIGVGTCDTEMVVGEEFLNPNGWLHGGVITSICDVTAGFAAATLGYRTTTVTSTTEFMRRGPSAGKILCRARTVKTGRTIIWTKSELYNEENVLLSESTHVFFCLEKIDLQKYN